MGRDHQVADTPRHRSSIFSAISMQRCGPTSAPKPRSIIIRLLLRLALIINRQTDEKLLYFVLFRRKAEHVLRAGCESPPAVWATNARARERRFTTTKRVSRFGAMPEPTVIVRMEEKEVADPPPDRGTGCFVRPDSRFCYAWSKQWIRVPKRQ